MLTTLRIKNLALVTDLTLDLQPGFNAITGETGAGKSIVIGALNLVLGQRADRTLIRTGTDSCTVEATFHMGSLPFPINDFLEEIGLEPCEEDQLFIRRSFTTAGANRQFINGSPTQLQTVAWLGESLVDMHGPHEHQSLLHPARQLVILDAFANLQTVRNRFANLLRNRLALEEEKAGLIVDEKTYAQQLDLLRYQVREIEQAGLTPDEEPLLEQDYQRATHATRLLQLCQTAQSILSDEEQSLVTSAGALGRALHELARLDPSGSSLLEIHEQALQLYQDLQSELSRYADKMDLDPRRLQDLEERWNRIQNLKRKYGPNLEDVLRHGESAAEQLQNLEQRDDQLHRIHSEIQRIDEELGKLARQLTDSRKKIIPTLSKAVTRQLADLGFKQSKLEIHRKTLEPGKTGSDAPPAWPFSSGLDSIDFQFAPNPGEPARPLRSIASSGEMSRVMLALKTVLADQDAIPLLVFDEIDANVGGQTAHVVGEKMRQIGWKRQVLCITHLPQVAAAASAHFRVTKQIRDGRTLTRVEPLDRQERIAELARMLGGKGSAAIKHAEELLDQASKD